MEDHVHILPNGDLTQGALHKPSKDQFDMHTHLYMCESDTCETSPAHNFGDHTHKLIGGDETSGPKPLPKEPGKPWQKMDSLSRRGREWVVTGTTGHVLARGATRKDALMNWQDGAHGDMVDKAMLDAGVDEAKWHEAKKASIASVGSIKWPLVQHIYEQMGG